MEKSKFDIALPQCIIDSYARHLVSEIRKYYGTEDTQLAQNKQPKGNDSIDADDIRGVPIEQLLPLSET